MSRTRVTVTVRPELIQAADRKAAETDRSRSWVIERALEGYLNSAPPIPPTVPETRATYAEGLGPARQAQLEADLALSPEERVRLAEETARVAELRARHGARDRIITFTRFEDFLEWDRREGLSS